MLGVTDASVLISFNLCHLWFKFPLFNGQRYGFSPTLQKHRKKNHTCTQSISLANRVSGKVSRASSNNTDSSS